MTGNPQLTEGQETLLRQAENCRELAQAIRESSHYDQNDCKHCLIAHAAILGIVTGFGMNTTAREDTEAFGLPSGSWEDCFGLTDWISAHDGTPTGAAAWLEQHALTLEA